MCPQGSFSTHHTVPLNSKPPSVSQGGRPGYQPGTCQPLAHTVLTLHTGHQYHHSCPQFTDEATEAQGR